MIKNKIAIFHPEGNIGSNVNIKAIVTLLIKHGYTIDYIHYPTDSIHDLHDNPNFTDITMPAQLPLSCFGASWNFCIGVDAGVCDAAKIYESAKIPFIFLSYEIFFLDEAKTYQEKELIFEIKKAAQLACAAISQDEVRANSLQREYELTCPILKIPVAGTECISFEKSNLLHERCRIPADKKILLHMGSLDSWTMADWLASNADSLPEDWVIVFHGRYGIKKDLFPPHSKIFYSRVPARTADELRKIIHSADCCSALYKPTYDSIFTGRNIAEVGLSSTKFSTALQHGIPVLINDSKAMYSIVTKENCGVFIDTSSKVSLQNLKSIQNLKNGNCYHAFSAYLDLKNTFKHLIDIITHDCKQESIFYTPEIDKEQLSKIIKKLPSRMLLPAIKSIYLSAYTKFLTKIKKYSSHGYS